MSDNRPPISEVMGELEVKSAEHIGKTLEEKAEEIIDESIDSLVRDFVHVFCYMKILQRKNFSMIGEIDQKIKEFLNLTHDTFSNEPFNPVLAVTTMINEASFPLDYKRFEDGGKSIHQEVLDGNVIFPKSRDLKTAEEMGFSKRYLIPGDVSFGEIAEKTLPSWVILSTENRDGEEIQENESRPKKYYPIAIKPEKKITETANGWGDMDGKERYDQYLQLKDGYRELKKINFMGLTAKEYLLVQAYNLFLNRAGGIDEDCGCLLMGSQVKNIRTGQVSCPVAHFYKSDQPIDVAVGQKYNIYIYSNSSKVVNLLMEPRFAINLAGVDNE